MPSPIAVPFGDLLRGYRLAAGLTQEELAERARLSVDAIGTLERGVRRSPRKETVALLSEALGLSGEDRQALLAAARSKPPLTPAISPPGEDVSTQHTRLTGPTGAQPDAPTVAEALPAVQPVDSLADMSLGDRQRAPAAERKLVTILFADVSGSTALGEGLDPEDLRALMGRYYAHAQRIVTERGGTLEKFIGDAVMAVFGLPHAHSDDAERALAAALALRDAVAGDKALAGRLELRLGVNTGAVVATTAQTDLARGDFLVTGDAVNVAARLEQAANPGEILASERTANATAISFLFGSAREVEVKGKSHALRVYPLVSQRPARQLSRPPLVGRTPDLIQLALLRERALRGRRPQVISILAPAGTGKTRLIEEFLAEVDPSDDWKVATARCLPYGQTLTYWPLRGLLEELLGASVSIEAICQVFRDGGYEPEDAQRLADVALSALGVESPKGQVERESLFSAWRLLIETFASHVPRILVFEDLHWASESLLDLVERVMQPGAEVPLLIVATSRTELLDRRPTWGSGRRNFTTLALEPLNAVDTRALVDRLAERASEATRAHIAARSGGNPFFAIELARGLEAESAPADNLPDTVQQALQERLDALTHEERAVLQAAAVVGRAVRPVMLQAILDRMAPDSIKMALDRLLTCDLITPAAGGAYTFRHILIREVAYGALTRGERVRLHIAVARWLEAVAGARLDEYIELIAYHYREATLLARESLAPLDAPIDPAHVVAILERAGERAGLSGAFAEARAHLEGAIAVAPDAEHMRLYEKLGDCMLLGDTAIQAYRTAFEHWQRTGSLEPHTGARILRKLLMMYIRWPATWALQVDASELAHLMAEVQRLAEATGDEDELWRIRVAEATWRQTDWARYQPGLPTDASQERLSVFRAAAAYFEQRQNWSGFSEALDGLAGLSILTGAYPDAIKALRRRLQTPGVPAAERGDAINMLAHLLLWSGHYGSCVTIIKAAVARLRPSEPVILLGKGPLWAVGAAGLSGRWRDLDWLMPLLQTGLELAQHDRRMAYVAAGYFVALHVALAHEDTHATEAAVAALDQLLAPEWTVGARALLAAYRTDDPSALALDASADVFPYLKMREFTYVGALTLMFLSERNIQAPDVLRAHARIQVGGEHAAYLNHAVAVAEAIAADDIARLAAAIDAAEAHGLIPHAARMRIVLAQRTGDQAQLERARPELERLGDHQFIKRLDEVVVMLQKQGKTP